MGDLAQTLIAHQPGRPLTKTPGGAQTALLLLLFESGALARGLPAIPLAHGHLLSLSLVHPRLPHSRASVHAIWALTNDDARRLARSDPQPNRGPSTLVEILRRMVPRTRGWVRLANLCAELSPLAAPRRRAARRARLRGQ